VRFLLDTQIFLWWASDPDKLPPSVLSLCEDVGNVLVVSVVSIWELQIKLQLGKMEFALNMPLRTLIEDQQRENDVELLAVTVDHALGLEQTPLHDEHKDPFDRLLIAQAKVENVPFVTVDAKIHKYAYPVQLFT